MTISIDHSSFQSIKSIVIILLLFIPLLLISQEKKAWTIMHYAAGSNSSEVDLLDDVGEMMQGKQSEDYDLILLIDRTAGHSNDSTTLGENFIETRLYRILQNAYEELDGKEFLSEIRPGNTHDLNMADANTLKLFIQYCKKYHPAENYMLILRSHGSGLSMCPDHESGKRDQLYPGEINDVLTKNESVNILGLDVCSMAGLENLYEWRPDGKSFGADYVIASAPVSAAWAYDQILGRLQSNKDSSTTDENYFSQGKENNIDPKTMKPLTFAKMIMEEIYDNQPWASWGLFDNSQIGKVKSNIDDLSKYLVNEDPSILTDIINNALSYHHVFGDDTETARLTQPYIDAYDFFNKIANNKSLSDPSRKKAKIIGEHLDNLVLYSYYGRGYLPTISDFIEKKSGVYLILPLGNRIYSKSGASFWSHSNWFHPYNQEKIGNAYGMYDWCSDGATSGNLKVDNFFELLDFLFDINNDRNGGLNKYQW